MALMLLKPLCYYTHSSSYESKLLRYIHCQRKHKLGEVCSQCGEDHSALNIQMQSQRCSVSAHTASYHQVHLAVGMKQKQQQWPTLKKKKKIVGSIFVGFHQQHIETSPCLVPDHLTALLPLWQGSCSKALPSIPAILRARWKSKAKQEILGLPKTFSQVLRHEIMTFAGKSPVPVTDPQSSSFDHSK